MVDSHALVGRVGEVFGWRIAAEVGGWALVPRRNDSLEAHSAGVAVASWIGPAEVPRVDVAVVHLQKGRDATRDGVCRAWAALEPGGRLVLAGGNDLGIKTSIRRLAEELDQHPDPVASGGRGRAMAFEKTGRAAPSPPAIGAFEVPGLRLTTPPGVFSSGEVDPGSALLLRHLSTAGPATSIFDPGCGCGVLGLAALMRWPDARAVLADIDARAVSAAAANAEAAGLTGRARCVWWDASSEASPVAGRCDLAVVNPPFHGGGVAVDLAPARAVFEAVGVALVPGGRALVVANRTLPWERDLAAVGSIRLLEQTRRYKLLEVTKS
jgi:16S rRNA (guanine1207-N2)-methyltransferase